MRISKVSTSSLTITTRHSEENRELAYDIYRKLKAKDLISIRTVEQFFDRSRNVPA
jgi:methionyl-tRNA synthetase